jgi:drug/metabolite transporter (DMT)-like permease
MNRTQVEGLFFTGLGIIGYGFMPIFTKAVLDTGFPALDLAVWRFGLAAPLFWLLVLLRDRRLSGSSSSKRPPRWHLLGLGFLISVSAMTSFWGLQRIPASTFMVLFFTYPAMVALISLLLGERLSTQGWIALALTIVGTVLTVPGFFTGFSDGDGPGFIWAILSAAIVATYFLINPRITRGYRDMSRASAWTLTGAFLPVAVIGLVNGVTAPPDPPVWANVLGLAVVGTALAIASMMVGLNKLGSSRTAILSVLELPLSIVLAVWLLGDSMQPVQVLGGVLILISAVLLTAPTTIHWPSFRRAGSPAEG